MLHIKRRLFSEEKKVRWRKPSSQSIVGDSLASFFKPEIQKQSRKVKRHHLLGGGAFVSVLMNLDNEKKTKTKPKSARDVRRTRRIIHVPIESLGSLGQGPVQQKLQKSKPRPTETTGSSEKSVGSVSSNDRAKRASERNQKLKPKSNEKLRVRKAGRMSKQSRSYLTALVRRDNISARSRRASDVQQATKKNMRTEEVADSFLENLDKNLQTSGSSPSSSISQASRDEETRRVNNKENKKEIANLRSNHGGRTTRSKIRQSSELSAALEKTKTARRYKISTCSEVKNCGTAAGNRVEQDSKCSDNPKIITSVDQVALKGEVDSGDCRPEKSNVENAVGTRKTRILLQFDSLGSSLVEDLEIVCATLGETKRSEATASNWSASKRSGKNNNIHISTKQKRPWETPNPSFIKTPGSRVLDLEIVNPGAFPSIEKENQMSRNLFEFNSEESNGHELRRSRRSSLRPERFGVYVDAMSGVKENQVSEPCGNKKKIKFEASKTSHPANVSGIPIEFDSSDDETTNIDRNLRRSRRSSIRPERYGIDEVEKEKQASASCGPEKKIEPKASDAEAKKSLPVSKRRRIFKMELKKSVRYDNGRLSLDSADDDNQWSEDEVILLREAHKRIDPKLVSFWDEVSEMVEGRSAVECREKWFALVKTPVIRTRKPPRQRPSIGDLIPTLSGDDIFNATPMKDIFLAGNGCESVALFGNIANLSPFAFGSAIKVGNTNKMPDHPEKITQRGYKTYIKEMKRGVNKKSKGKLPAKAAKSTKNLAVSAGEGDVEMRGRLSPGGTLRLKTNGYEDECGDEYLDDEDENDTLYASGTY